MLVVLVVVVVVVMLFRVDCGKLDLRWGFPFLRPCLLVGVYIDDVNYYCGDDDDDDDNVDDDDDDDDRMMMITRQRL